MKDTIFKKENTKEQKRDILNNFGKDNKSSLIIHNSEFHNKTFSAKADNPMDYNLRGLRKKLENPQADTMSSRKHAFLSDFKKLFK